jgi:hypothetical protein
MINLKYGFLQRNKERESKLRQLFQEMHQVLNSRIFVDKAILKGGVPAKAQIQWIIEASKVLSIQDHRTVYVAKKGSFSYFFFKKFKSRGAFLDPLYIDFMSTRAIAMGLLDSFFFAAGPLERYDIRKIYDEVHRNTFGDVYSYSIKDIEPASSFLGFKKYEWRLSC